jgi:hypothetical protein
LIGITTAVIYLFIGGLKNGGLLFIMMSKKEEFGKNFTADSGDENKKTMRLVTSSNNNNDTLPKTVSDGITVPAKTKIPLISVLLIILATTFGTFGISNILTVFQSFTYSITMYIKEAFSWEEQYAYLIVGILFVVFAAVILKTSSKFTEWANQIKFFFGRNIEKQPLNYYNMKVIPTEYIVDHLVTNRGCEVYEDPDGRGFGVYCPNHPLSEGISDIIRGKRGMFSKGTTIGILVFVNLILIFPPLAIREGVSDVTLTPWVWYGLLVIILLMLYDTNLLPMWAIVFVYMMHVLIAAVIAPEILLIVRVAVPGFVIFFGITLILYIFKSEHCEKETNWWCDRL